MEKLLGQREGERERKILEREVAFPVKKIWIESEAAPAVKMISIGFATMTVILVFLLVSLKMVSIGFTTVAVVLVFLLVLLTIFLTGYTIMAVIPMPFLVSLKMMSSGLAIMTVILVFLLLSLEIISIGFATMAVILVFSLVVWKIRIDTSTSSEGEYKVYLSFRFEDTGKGLTDFFYLLLDDAGIRTFKKYSDESFMGEEIDPEVRKAIAESKIFIPIFSQNYASCPGCLSELALRIKCMTRGQHIFPIFYDVNPSNMRKQTGSYAEAFLQHRKLFDASIVQEWAGGSERSWRIEGMGIDRSH